MTKDCAKKAAKKRGRPTKVYEQRRIPERQRSPGGTFTVNKLFPKPPRVSESAVIKRMVGTRRKCDDRRPLAKKSGDRFEETIRNEMQYHYNAAPDDKICCNWAVLKENERKRQDGELYRASKGFYCRFVPRGHKMRRGLSSDFVVQTVTGKGGSDVKKWIIILTGSVRKPEYQHLIAMCDTQVWADF